MMAVVTTAFAGFAFLLGRERLGDLCNESHGGGLITRNAAQDFGERYLLAGFGVTANEMDIAEADDRPLAVCTDLPEADEPANFAILGVASGTLPMIASKAIAVGDEVYTTAAGRVTDDGGVAGSYHVGVAITAASDAGDQIEVAHQAPVAVA